MNKAASNTRKNHGFSKQQHSAERTISSDKRASRNLMENMRLYPPGPGRHRIKLQFENLLHFQEELEYWGLDSNQVEPCCWMWVSWSFVNLSTIYFFFSFFRTYTQVWECLFRVLRVLPRAWGKRQLILKMSTFTVTFLKDRVMVLVHITDKRWKKNFTESTIPINQKSFHSVIRYNCLTLTNSFLHKNLKFSP